MGLEPLVLAVLTTALIALVWRISKEDVARFVIPNSLVAIIAALGIVACLLTAPDTLVVRLVWAVVLFDAGVGFSLLAERIIGRPALGMGDVKLFAAATLWLGPAMMGVFLMLAAGSALIVALLRGQTQGRLAFGPYLSLALLGLWCVKMWQWGRG